MFVWFIFFWCLLVFYSLLESQALKNNSLTYQGRQGNRVKGRQSPAEELWRRPQWRSDRSHVKMRCSLLSRKSTQKSWWAKSSEQLQIVAVRHSGDTCAGCPALRGHMLYQPWTVWILIMIGGALNCCYTPAVKKPHVFLHPCWFS